MKRFSGAVRWIARILSLVMVAYVIVFAIGLGTFNPMELIPEERGVFIALLVMMMAALFAWRWELLGGLVVLAGFGLFYYFEGSGPSGYFAVFPLAGCLYLIAWLLEHQPRPATAPIKNEKQGKKKKRGRVAKA